MQFSVLRFIKHSRGAVLAEAAIVLPIFLLLLGATAEFGRFFYTYNTLAKATRVSARYVSGSKLTGANIANAQNLAVYGSTTATGTPILPGLTTSNILVSPTSGTPETVKVSVQNYTYQPIIAIGPLASLAGVQITPSTTIKYLFSTPIV